MSLRRTPLYDRHAAAGARFVEFGGWEMPVHYGEGIQAEHDAVRQRVGLFDVSHMGEIEIRGPGAVAAVDRLIANDLQGAEDGQAVYTPLCTPAGGIVDDLLVYRLLLQIDQAALRHRQRLAGLLMLLAQRKQLIFQFSQVHGAVSIQQGQALGQLIGLGLPGSLLRFLLTVPLRQRSQHLFDMLHSGFRLLQGPLPLRRRRQLVAGLIRLLMLLPIIGQCGDLSVDLDQAGAF